MTSSAIGEAGGGRHPHSLGPSTSGKPDDEAIPAEGILELAAVQAAKGRLEAAVLELSQTVSKVQFDLDSAMRELLHGRSASAKLASDEGACSPTPRSPEIADEFLLPQASECQTDIGQAVDDKLELQAGASSKFVKVDDFGQTPSGAWYSSVGHPNARLLPETWPSSLIIRWSIHIEPSEWALGLSGKVNKQSSQSEDSAFSGMSSIRDKVNDVRAACVIRPNSRPHVLYSFLTSCVLLYDVLVIPWILAWDIPIEGSWRTLAWVIAAFWTCDIIVNFITGFYAKGQLVSDPAAIAKRYMLSWFVLDVLLVAGDWANLLGGNSSALKTLRVVKVGKLLRLLAVVRLIKVVHTISELVEGALSEFTRLALAFVNASMVLVFFVHMQSCLWFLIGRLAPSDTGARWTGASMSDFMEESILYQYVTSAHWAITQFTLGAMEVNPANSVERMYTIFCLFQGIFFGSTLVSACSAAMLEINMDKREGQLKRRQMRRFLRENKVSPELASMVDKQLTERLATKGKIREHQVEGLTLLSSSMQSKLRLHLYEPHLRKNPLFQLWTNLDVAFVERFCSGCMCSVYLNNDDEMFQASNEAEGAYFLISGSMQYMQEPESFPLAAAECRAIESGVWLAEPAMWTHWFHVGTARALEYCEAVQVQVEKLVQSLQHPAILQVTHDYCMQFHQRVRAARPPASSWPDDLRVPGTDWSEMVLAMSKESQIIIGTDAIRQAAIGRSWKPGALQHRSLLAGEIRQGKCTVMLNSQGEVERVASIVALKIVDSCANLLIQIGKRHAGKLKAACQLPGGKQDHGELVMQTFDRLLHTKMAPFSDNVEVTQVDREVQWKSSKEYGINTKYIRSIVCVNLKSHVLLHNGVQLFQPEVLASSLRKHSDGSFVAASSLDPGDALWQRDVFPIEDDKGGLALYAWFSELEFEEMSGPRGEQVLALWLARLAEHFPDSDP